ncbi:MAG: TVP38/TMEM64 family protein [Acidobacteria bacterium]|nr:TVP38/TMEM64 family protein [Acidobacteriota bacterium]
MTDAATGAKPTPWGKLAILVLIVVAMVAGYLQFGDALSLERIASQESSLRSYQAAHPVLVFGVAFAIYVGVTGLSLPGATVLTLVFGWYFGFLRGLLLVSFASTLGASLAFLLSRYILRGSIQSRFGERLATFNDALARDGAFYLFTLRLVPAVPFFVINLVMGLTPVKLATYWWVSQLGMFPGTAVYVYAGATVPDLQTLSAQGVGGILLPRLLVAFVLLGVFPLVVKLTMKRLRPAAPKPSGEGS